MELMGSYSHFNFTRARYLISAMVLALMLAGCSSKAEFKPQKASQPDDQEEIYRKYNVERGKRLVELGGCSQCHTPKIKTSLGFKPDKDKFLSGYPSDKPLPNFPYADIVAGESERDFYTTDATIWVGRWGVSFAPNLTPDPETGIGNWKEEDFIEIFRGNKHFAQGDQVTTPMPVKAYSQLSYFELKSIFVYLQTIEPISNEVPKRIPPENDLFQGSDT